ncbi:hypothetical protein RF11_09785 [Thelohanellus kitauei]|uniref:Uncharacterized protein n=1 Tax=Thelohanellus kitauei TaxID=669202 RepID=A0A0C2MYY1_THEKT|nr:hypothetical protein RF11_09785 [Thelohanellus kitauei]
MNETLKDEQNGTSNENILQTTLHSVLNNIRDTTESAIDRMNQTMLSTDDSYETATDTSGFSGDMMNSQTFSKHPSKSFTSSVYGRNSDTHHHLVQYSFDSDWIKDSHNCERMQNQLLFSITTDMKILQQTASLYIYTEASMAKIEKISKG